MVRLFTVIFLFVIIIGGSVIILGFNSTGEKLDIEKSTGELEKDMEELESIKNEINSASSENHTEDHEHESDGFGPMEGYQDKEGTIKFFFGSIMMENPDLFIQSFKTEVISNALFADSNPDKDKVALDLIKKISKNGTLEDVSLKEGKSTLGISSNEYFITLWYRGGEKAEVSLSLSSYSSYHSNNSEAVFVIDTSPLEIIESIEESLK